MWHRIDDPDHPPPKDGTRVLLCLAGWKPFVGAGYYSETYSDDERTVGWEWELNARPSHWAALPPPPAEDTP